MASTPVISSPADFSTQPLPFTLSGTTTAAALVDARDDLGLLLPATLNPVVADAAGNYSFYITGLTNSGKNAAYLAAGGQIQEVSAGIAEVTGSRVKVRKDWNATRVVTIPDIVVPGGGGRIVLGVVSIQEVFPSSLAVSIGGLSFTAHRDITVLGTAAYPVGIYSAVATAGTYSGGTVTLTSASGNSVYEVFASVWTGTTGIGAVSGVDVAGNSNTRPTMSLTTTGATGSVVLGFYGNDDSYASAQVLNTVAAGDTDDCSMVDSATGPDGTGQFFCRITATVSAGSHGIGVRTPLSSVWTIAAIELLS